MGFAPSEKSVTCTYCKPPRASGPLIATMDVPPAALLRSPSSTYPEVLDEILGLSGVAGSPRVAECIRSLEMTNRGKVGKASN
jgi:hypothetical protein